MFMAFLLCFHCSWKWMLISFIITLWWTLVFLSLRMSRFKVWRISQVTRSLNCGKLYFCVNSSLKVESYKIRLGNNKLLVMKLKSVWFTHNGYIFFANTTFISIFLTNSILGFKINIPHIEFNFLALSIYPMFSQQRRLDGAYVPFSRFSVILKLKTLCIGSRNVG
jgi:hypothetical protein